jgi:hypothetical protein
MNSAYSWSFVLICSSTRICSVSFFGGLGGDFRIATSVLLWCLRFCRIPILDIESHMRTNQIHRSIPSLHRNWKAGSGAASLMGLGEPTKPHTSRWATTGDRLMVENADSMTAPAKKRTEAKSLPLLTYSVSGRENCVGAKRK